MINAFIEYLKEQVRNHSIYVWGGQGQQGSQITEQWIRDRETSARNADRVIKYWKKQVRDGYGDVLRAFDCSGLGCFFFQKNGLIPHDMTANGLKGQCDLIDRKDLQKGDLVFRCDQDGRAYHVGYVIDDGKNVIEAEGRDLGVREHRLKGWDRFGHPRFFNEHHSRLLKYRKPMMRGEDVTDDMRIKIGLQKYHFSNFDEFLGVPLEEVKKNMKPRVVATSVNNIIEEYFSTNDGLDAHVEGRIVVLD